MEPGQRPSQTPSQSPSQSPGQRPSQSPSQTPSQTPGSGPAGPSWVELGRAAGPGRAGPFLHIFPKCFNLLPDL